MQQMRTQDTVVGHSGCSSCSQPSSTLPYLLLERCFGELGPGLRPAFGFPCKEREEAAKSMGKPLWVLPQAGDSRRMPGGSARFPTLAGREAKLGKELQQGFCGLMLWLEEQEG